MGKFRTIGAVAGALALSAAGFAASAGAHFTDQYHGNDRATVDSYHDHLNGHDNECDSNRIYVNGYDNSGYRGPKYDPDGCTSQYYAHLDGVNFTSYRICEEGVSCNSFRGT